MSMRIENWSVGPASMDPYKAPELQLPAIYGKVYGHPKREDGSQIKTSYIVDTDAETQTVKTKNSVYEIGEVDPEYEKAFPNARERLFSK